jgi:hypothetical protein
MLITVPEPSQLSVQLREAGAGRHSTLISAGAVMTGGVFSSTVMVWFSLIVFPQGSIAIHVLVIVTGQLPPLETSVPMDDPDWPQLSAQASEGTAGTSPKHDTVISAGIISLNTGAVVSITVICCDTAAKFPQASR